VKTFDRIACGLLATVLAGGCSTSTISTEGRVALDGKPVETGSITFVPVEDTPSADSGGAIERGAYSLPRSVNFKPGVFRVEIRSQKKTGNRIPAGSPAPPGTLVDEVVEIIPEKYNAASMLRVEVKPGSNTFDFALDSK
jgi:hypothetical protein